MACRPLPVFLALVPILQTFPQSWKLRLVPSHPTGLSSKATSSGGRPACSQVSASQLTSFATCIAVYSCSIFCSVVFFFFFFLSISPTGM